MIDEATSVEKIESDLDRLEALLPELAGASPGPSVVGKEGR